MTTLHLERDLEAGIYASSGFSHAELDDLVELAANTANTPSAAINLMRADTQVTVASYGIDLDVCAREDSMCNAVLYAGHAVEVADASQDARWADNPFVTGERASVRFYFAQQLVSPRGIVIGTLCVFDERPRTLAPEQVRRLTKIATWIVNMLELRVRTDALESAVDELTRTRNELQRSNEQLTMFAGQVAHDLRGPVTAISAALAMLAEEPASSAQSRAWLLRSASGSTSRMDALIGNMLAYASLDGRPQMSQVDLNEVADRVRDDIAADLQGVRVTLNPLPVVWADVTQVRVVLQNLMSNAAKFSRQSDVPRLRVSGGSMMSDWWFEVADNGPGVPVASRERVFLPLIQLNPTMSGIGLGLATCRRIIDSLGGTISLQQAAEGGALVRVTIPRPARVQASDEQISAAS